MKLLIAYDGSDCAETALDDLPRAGLPDEAEALVLTIGELWLPKVESSNKENPAQRLGAAIAPASETDVKHPAKAHSEVKSLARHAQRRLKMYFPNWKVEIETGCGSAAQQIIARAGETRADLIVVGSHGRGALGRFVLGSVSQKVLSESPCSVRVARGRVEVDPVPPRVAVAYDGSPGANQVIETIAARSWREGSEFRLITVADKVSPTAIGRFVPPVARWVEEENKTELEWIEKIAAAALEKLRAAGLSASHSICTGNPKQILVEKAAEWHADCIFAGANRFGSRVEQFLLGSVSAAIASRAHCSVEVVRKHSAKI